MAMYELDGNHLLPVRLGRSADAITLSHSLVAIQRQIVDVLRRPLFPLAWDELDGGAAATLDAEVHLACGQREEGVVATTTHVVAGVEVGAVLANDDLARTDDLPAETLHTEALGIGITTVSRRGRAFLVCHLCSCLSS